VEHRVNHLNLWDNMLNQSKPVASSGDNDSITRATYNRTARAWVEKNFEIDKNEEGVRKFADYLKTGKKVLDAGCGPGKHLEQFLALGLDVVGIDFSEKMLKEARRRVPKGDFKLMNMRDLRFKRDSFDGLWCAAALVHIEKEDTPFVLSEFSRVLKNKGVLGLMLKQGEGEKFEGGQGEKRFYSYYQEKEAIALLVRARFRILEIVVKEAQTGTWIRIFAEINK
jgi:ubiquinone/menaquinone biosynthesis C-methylase UbiE